MNNQLKEEIEKLIISIYNTGYDQGEHEAGDMPKVFLSDWKNQLFTLIQKRDEELNRRTAAEIASVVSNYKQEMTAYRGALIQKLEKLKNFEHVHMIPNTNVVRNKALDEAIEVIRKI